MLQSIQKHSGIVISRFFNKGIQNGYNEVKDLSVHIKNKGFDGDLVRKVLSIGLKAIALFLTGWTVLSTISLLGSVTSVSGLALLVAIKTVQFILLSDLIQIADNIKPKGCIQEGILKVKSVVQEKTLKAKVGNALSYLNPFKEDSAVTDLKEILVETYIREGANRLIELYKQNRAEAK